MSDPPENASRPQEMVMDKRLTFSVSDLDFRKAMNLAEMASKN
jgi:hypothetical protein